jgi:hypothetical protein
MLQILHIHIEDIVVGTEYYIDILQFTNFTAGHELEPAIVQQLVFELEFDILAKVSDHF